MASARYVTPLILFCCAVTAFAVRRSARPQASGLSLTAKDTARIKATQSQAAPPLSVADVIGLATIGDHEVSPDHKHVAVVINRGNLARNTIDSKMLIYRTDELLGATKPDVAVEFGSDSNEESAIAHMRWLSPSVLSFFGRRPGQVPQVYSVDIFSKKIKQLTHSPTRVGTFALMNGGDLVYAADPPTLLAESSIYSKMQARGFALSPKVSIADLMKRDWQAAAEGFRQPRPIIRIVQQGRERTIMQLSDGPVGFTLSQDFASNTLRFSPAGNLALIAAQLDDPPWWTTRWAGYREGILKFWFDTRYKNLARWKVVDLQTGRARELMDAPTLNPSQPVLWMPDRRSAVFVNAVLPLDSLDSAENAARARQKMTAEIDLETGRVVSVITRQTLPAAGAVENWDAENLTLTLNPEDKQQGRLSFRKTASGWIRIPVEVQTSAGVAAPQLEVEQGANEPWKVVALDPRTRQPHVLCDPNPGLLEKRRVAHVTEIRWQTKSGAGFSGDLYWPVDYVEGRRYPILLQTHGRARGFAPSGFSTTGYAAQPLAGAGMFVLQMSLNYDNLSEADKAPARDGPLHQEQIEAVVDFLDHHGLIDRSKVGLMGFSATCYHVLYTLTHSHYPIAAATVTDGVDKSYVQQIVLGGPSSYLTEGVNAMNGGPPFGPSLQAWLERAPGFNLNRVTAPLLLTALGHDSFGPAGALEEWEPYAGLLQQGKPAEMVYIPAGAHELVKPWERFTSQQNNTVDWYRFWLQGYERSEPVGEAGETREDLEKQYARWRQLRKLQEQNETKRRETGPTPIH